MPVPVEDGEALPAGAEVTAGGTAAEATDMAGAMVLACGLAPFGSAHSRVKKYLLRSRAIALRQELPPASVRDQPRRSL